ncbi:MAG: metallophosphoesterase [Marmoricola sp.]|nr:metallophosphoesterase [Marmoricola sp.]
MVARRRVLRGLGYLLVWLVVAVPAWGLLFSHSSTEMVVASHDAVVRPNFDGQVRLDMGPYLPDVRSTSGGWIGVDIVGGKTTATTAPELAVRYAAIAAHPDAEQQRVREEIGDLLADSALRAAVLGLVPIGLWLLLGASRRAELRRRVAPRSVAASVTAVAVVVVLVAQPWRHEPEHVGDGVWLNVAKAFPEVSVPPELSGWEIQGGFVTEGTRRLVFSLLDTYKTSKVFYRDVADRMDEVTDRLHPKGEGETVAVEVSDRHDNIGMDEVVRAAADAAGATVVIDAGDDTSTGQPWEGFSLDSLDNAFGGDEYDARVAISGNHDHGTFVSRYLQKRGWTHLTGKAVTPFADVRIIGVDDPRSSGLGNWRDQKGLTFDEVKATVADDVCKLDEQGDRIATLVVHDANLGATALERGCTDLVLAGHLHVQKGPTRVLGTNGKVGYSYTNGTTGGAAYAIAIGSKLRRDAEFTFVTYRDGRPVGIQPVTVQTTGMVSVADYVPLDLG